MHCLSANIDVFHIAQSLLKPIPIQMPVRYWNWINDSRTWGQYALHNRNHIKRIGFTCSRMHNCARQVLQVHPVYLLYAILEFKYTSIAAIIQLFGNLFNLKKLWWKHYRVSFIKIPNCSYSQIQYNWKTDLIGIAGLVYLTALTFGYT